MEMLVKISAIILTYFLISFVVLDLNVFVWHWVARLIFVILISIIIGKKDVSKN